MEFYDLNKFGILRRVEVTELQRGNFLFMNIQIFLLLFAAFCGVITSLKCSQFLAVASVSYLYTKVLQVIHLVQLHGLMNLLKSFSSFTHASVAHAGRITDQTSFNCMPT
jgi:hypothetical protein